MPGGGESGPEPAEGLRGPWLRIGTWNVEYARGPRNTARRALLVEREADVWVLTETHDDLGPGPGFTQAHTLRQPGRPDGARWAAIWSLHPMTQLPVEDPVRTVATLVDSPIGPLVVFGTVLPWHCDRGDSHGDPRPRNWEEHHRVIPLQAAEWKRLAEEHPEAALVVAGDLNTGITSGYGTRRGRGLLAAGMSSAGLRCLTASEVNPDDGGPLIDHICASGAVRSSRTEVWSGLRPMAPRLSDHPGVLVEIRRAG